MKIEIELTPEDIAMLRRVEELRVSLRRMPKRRDVVHHKGHNYDHEKAQQHIFERLKMLGLIGHATNGHCWTTEAAKALAL